MSKLLDEASNRTRLAKAAWPIQRQPKIVLCIRIRTIFAIKSFLRAVSVEATLQSSTVPLPHSEVASDFRVADSSLALTTTISKLQPGSKCGASLAVSSTSCVDVVQIRLPRAESPTKVPPEKQHAVSKRSIERWFTTLVPVSAIRAHRGPRIG